MFDIKVWFEITGAAALLTAEPGVHKFIVGESCTWHVLITA